MEAARPKTRGGNVRFTRDIPVFGTCASKIQLYVRDGRRTVLHEAETRQMDARVEYIEMPRTLAEDEVNREVKPCARCGAELYLEGRP